MTACRVDGCDRPRARSGSRLKRDGSPYYGSLCHGHASRRRRGASLDDSPLAPRQPIGSEWAVPNGYLMQWSPTHPLAFAGGRVLVHRAVLYDEIGPGEHACHWCSLIVSWDRREVSDPLALTVDHLDSNKQNNDPANLVASCRSCNTSRGQINRRRVA